MEIAVIAGITTLTCFGIHSYTQYVRDCIRLEALKRPDVNQERLDKLESDIKSLKINRVLRK